MSCLRLPSLHSPLRKGHWMLLLLLAAAAPAETPATPQALQTPQQVVLAMIDNENAAAAHPDRYEYVSNERSGRTGGHLWTERVVETPPGRMRLLLAIDGKPLSPERMQQERARLENLRTHPAVFIKHEQNTRAEEKRARDMLEVLPRDFLFDHVVLQDGLWHMDFHPNPNYTPSGVQERILHNMAGKLVIDASQLRLVRMEFHLVQDVPIGFGLLADVQPGTNFISDREQIDGRWHTMHVATVVHAKAVIFKTVDLNIDLHRSQFQPLDHDVSVPEAAEMLLHSPTSAMLTASN
ncbi:hypothetical protein GOB94_08535 [Granulicella sp. 5B5]|uniref:hypothetical protein n=1 Tax=Granulicella sp. 5B5 TaxID=1617967 RepID=UPI0015F6AAD3|nr:hypothetical protein [Granulicella sp. 5B5]QMV18722.1 hypothetical protein GOB94_08535 [Granulicella sp. 5B5]